MNEPQGDSSTAHLRVAAEVRAHLARQRISGRQAAFALGWKQPYIARRLSGEIPFDVSDLAKIADLLGVPVTAFFETPAAAAYARPLPAIPTGALHIRKRSFSAPRLGLAA